jgi:hypothetical protein
MPRADAVRARSLATAAGKKTFAISVTCGISLQPSPEGGAMSDGESVMHTEDIELDETTAESVVGGYAVRHITLDQALKQGCVEISCMRNGSLMRDKKGHEFLIPYKN